MKMDDKNDFLQKMDKDPIFKTLVLNNNQNYEKIKKYEGNFETSHVPDDILKKVEGRELYFYFGFKQPILKKNLHEVLVFLVKNFDPK